MSSPDRTSLLLAAAEAVLAPLARLCVAQGLPFAQAEEVFKRAYVRAARDAHRAAGRPASRDVSQVSVSTGINRREVARISAEMQPLATQRTAPATQVFMRWVSSPGLRRPGQLPQALPRSGPAPSFEALAREVTRHVHPRSLLDELCRLGLVQLDDEGETVSLLTDRFVPDDDDERLYGYLGANVGDHLRAATDNVIHRDRRHVEQAVFTDDLSETSASQLTDLCRGLWATVTATAVPALERLIEEDKAAGRSPAERVRIGLYSYHEPLTETRHEPPPSPAR